MSLDKLCKATGLTLAIVGLSVAHSFATGEQTINQTILESELEKIGVTRFPIALQKEIEKNATR